MSGKTEVVLVLNKELTTDGKDETGDWVAFTTVDDTSSESEWGGKLIGSYFCLPNDKTAPEIVMWDDDNDPSTADIAKVIISRDIINPENIINDCYSDYAVRKHTSGTITLYFSEAIKTMDSALTVDTFSVADFIITDIKASFDDKTVILSVEANADYTSVNTTVTQNLDIYDLGENKLAAGSTWAVTLEDPQTN